MKYLPSKFRFSLKTIASLFAGLIIVFFVLPLHAVDPKQKILTAIEITGEIGEELSPAKLQILCKKQRIPTTSIYQWKNHLVVYGSFIQPGILVNQIRKAYLKSDIRYYGNPFYEFNRTRCSDTSVAKEWDNILLTTNLVSDTIKQKEYMEYHATQFTQWPEVATGFCNASFQQLLVFRYGRQLMLVISIPKGASLDELNPKTTENNPRVDEWNRIMAKYQEGLPGTVEGEAWVFLKQIVK